MNSLMNGGLDSSSSVKDVKLKSNERLQVHMDCMNAHGQLVEIEDVDEMGGQVCWLAASLFVRLIKIIIIIIIINADLLTYLLTYLFVCSAGPTSECRCTVSRAPRGGTRLTRSLWETHFYFLPSTRHLSILITMIN